MTIQFQHKHKLIIASFIIKNHVLTNVFKFTRIKNDSILSQSKSIKKQEINATHKWKLHHHRFVHILQLWDNLVHARSQGCFRIVMEMRVKVWSICLSDFTFLENCRNHLHPFSCFFNPFHLRTQILTFTHLILNPLYISSTFLFLFHFSKLIITIFFFYPFFILRDSLFYKNLQSWESYFIFLVP